LTIESKETVVFVASPSDVNDERELVRSTAEQVEQACLQIGARIRVTGWEQLPPGYGRPQDRINELVDSCDVFIAILHTRWGTDAGSGESGFGEEFERVLRRRQSGETRPAIALFFKQVEPALEDDAGPQLSKVLEFRNRVKAEHLVLYREFSSREGLLSSLFQLLVSIVTSQVGSQSPEPQGNDSQTMTSPSPAALRPDSRGAADSANPAASQVAEVLDSFLQPLRGGPFPDSPDLDRFLLFALALRDESLLPTHVANRLYKRRAELELVAGESKQWLKALVADFDPDGEDNLVIPGWKFVNDDDVASQCAVWAFRDEFAVARGAVAILRRLGERPDTLWPTPARPISTVAPEWWVLIDGPVGAEVTLHYLASVATRDDVGLVDELIRLRPTHLWADELRAIAAALRLNLDPLVEVLLARKYSSPRWARDLLLGRLSDASPDSLLKLVRAKRTDLQDLAIAAYRDVLSQRSPPASWIAAALDSDIEDAVTSAVAAVERSRRRQRLVTSIELTFENGKPPSAVVAQLAALTIDRDTLALGLTDVFDDTAWRALTLMGDSETLAKGRELIEQGPDAWIASEARLTDVLADREKLLRFIYDERVEEVCRALGRLPEADRTEQDRLLILSAAERVKPWRRAPLAAALAEFKVASDAPAILEIAEEVGLDREALTMSAMTIGGLTFAKDHLNSPDHRTAQSAARFACSDRAFADEEVFALLSSSNGEVRRIATRTLVSRWPRARLDRLITDYTSQASYYYNVVAIVDRALHAPGPLKGA
jgi:hypothetical protein